ncbi:MAG: P-II family nitrogen regulator [Burkholderiales bacterium]|nr:MAG: P-II family nitrogen regulator [Burkholderiales bacterium]
MKEIKAVIGTQKLASLHESLRAIPGFPGMTVAKAERYGRAGGTGGGRHTIREELTDHVARYRIEMVVPDESAGALFDAVVACLSSGAPGDSVVWITDVERASFVHKTR